MAQPANGAATAHRDGSGRLPFRPIAVSGIRAPSRAAPDDGSRFVEAAAALGAGSAPPSAPAFHTDFPARAQTRARTPSGPAIDADVLVTAPFNLFFHHLGTRSHPAPALKSS
ncbi:hypothetical protein LK07_28450 [Streptomyces pluripotens]|uniref:Uncharacterized protein n=1 Tax=Streptomyces pluripotens TaxID=1355015 RepID=A0A221P5C6_9ACTN|nr:MULTISPECIES: hypothetical protein [Streptomyces]ARP73062.1 hypothetical protein LK06_027280 [Streptomyces pluripotens]ASN27314.1 hypothetical protein LK07_28450 [Streptomyces pluripotens]KIE28702.1 hypothetical protein LK08_01410 [Streptomyces sp. MUSC 125]MCH0557979.1 hypothetical protein [Streptomyces sp. MUM 16J]